ncbi:uncharacterized protein [Mytilus edulis]
MAWCLDKNKDEKTITLLINGRQAVQSNGEDFPAVKSIKPGRNADEIWIAFTGMENGRRLLRRLFSAKNDFSNMLNLESNTLFITSVYDRAGECIPAIPGCSRKRKATQPLEHVDVEEGNDEGVNSQTVEEKFVGKFELDILSIYPTPEKFLCRPVKQQWVDYLKIKLLNSKSQTTIFPMLLDPECVSEEENFDASLLTTYRYYALGGNHFTGALRHLIESGENVNYRKLQARVYVGLTSEEARIVGNLHNKSSSTVLKLNFQDKVFQARQIRKETGESNLRKKLEEALCCLGNEMSKDSMSTVLSVARYTDENYKMFLQIVHSFEFEEGLEKSIPQNLFRILQGLNKETVTHALQKSTTEGLKKGLEWIRREKNLAVLKTAFVNQTDSLNWESAKTLFPQESSRLRDFADEALKKKSLPTGFIEFCSQARDPLMHPTEFTVNFDIKINNKTCSGNTVESLICKYKKKIVLELEKNKNNIIAEHFEQKSVDSLCTQSDCTIDTLDNTQVSISDTQITHIPETQMSLNLSEQ